MAKGKRKSRNKRTAKDEHTTTDKRRSKGKHTGKHHDKHRDRPNKSAGPAALPGAGSTSPAVPEVSTEPAALPPGQRHYDLPFGAIEPRLINPALGLHNLVSRAGHNAAYSIDVTLLDAPDHRLIRSGVLLAHRVLEGRGEWYLTCPEWVPLLPLDRVELMGHADLPEEFADLIRPLRRRGTLGPVAALNCDRREFALRDDRGTTMALLRDEKVTVRRGGLTTARYRQVLMTPVGPGLNEEQRGWLERALIAAGAIPLDHFPRLVTRLGAPATGPTDIPQIEPFDATAPFRRFVSQLLGMRLRRIVEADLALRGGDRGAAARLSEQAALLQVELRGLSFVLDQDWVEDLYDELGWVLLDPTDAHAGDHLVARMRSERYLTLLERLVGATRSPKLAESRTQPTADVLGGLLTATLGRIRAAADRLSVGAPVEAWVEAERAFGQFARVADITTHVLAEETSSWQRVLAGPRRLLAEVAVQQARHAQVIADAAQLAPEEAFAAGRAYEREQGELRRLRRRFGRAWAKAAQKLPVLATSAGAP